MQDMTHPRGRASPSLLRARAKDQPKGKKTMHTGKTLIAALNMSICRGNRLTSSVFLATMATAEHSYEMWVHLASTRAKDAGCMGRCTAKSIRMTQRAVPTRLTTSSPSRTSTGQEPLCTDRMPFKLGIFLLENEYRKEVSRRLNRVKKVPLKNLCLRLGVDVHAGWRKIEMLNAILRNAGHPRFAETLT